MWPLYLIQPPAASSLATESWGQQQREVVFLLSTPRWVWRVSRASSSKRIKNLEAEQPRIPLSLPSLQQMPVQGVFIAINSTINSIGSCSRVYVQDTTLGRLLPPKIQRVIKHATLTTGISLILIAIILYFIIYLINSCPYPVQLHYFTRFLYLSWKVHNISAGISGSCGAATCFPLSSSPWHLSLHPASGNRSGLPWHDVTCHLKSCFKDESGARNCSLSDLTQERQNTNSENYFSVTQPFLTCH